MALQFIHTVFATFVLFMLCFVPAAYADTDYTLQTGPSSSSYHPVGVALATLVKLKRDQSNNVALSIKPSSGPIENMHALLSGKTDIAFVDATTLLAAITAKAPFNQYKTTRNLRTLATLWQDQAHLLIKADFVRKGELQDFKSLTGQAVSFGSLGSVSHGAASDLFRKNGLIHDKLFNLPSLDRRETVDAFSTDIINGFALFSYPGDQLIQDILLDQHNEAHILDITADQFSKLNDHEIPIWDRVVIPSNTYHNQPDAIQSVGQKNFLVTLDTFPKEDALHLTRTLYENLTFLKALHPAAEKINTTIVKTKLIAPLHAGSQSYMMNHEPCSGLWCLFN